jgi:hypothetical protein
MSWGRNQLFPPLILKLALLCCLQWLVEVTMADVPTAGAPAVLTTSCHPVTQGQTPPLVEHHHQPG